MSEDGLRQVLARHGYRLLFREHEWVECLIATPSGQSGRGEAHVGRGLDRAAALEAALAKCFPSRISRELFQVAVGAARRAAAIPGPSDAPGLAASVEGSLLSQPQPSPGGAPALSSSVEASRVGHGDLSMSGSHGDASAVSHADLLNRGRTPDFGPTAAPRPARVPPASPARPAILARPREEVRREPDRARAIEELSILMDRIEESRPELAWSTAPRQRLAILAWICEARSHTDVFPEDVEIREAVARVSRQLTEIGKAFWPGSVTALQLQMQPTDLPRHLLGGSPATWARAAELAERALANLEHSDERRGLDPYGWGDASLLEPRPAEPHGILDGLVSAVETSWGPLDRFAEPRNPEDLPVPSLYQQWVRELRWIRVQDVDPDQWARVMGRLRWWALRRNGPVQIEGRELEPSYRPERSWSNLLQKEGLLGDRALSPKLVEAARDKFEGKRLLLVSNRRDPEAQSRLHEALPGTELQWRFAEPQLLDAFTKALEEGGFDAVVGAVGLQSPTTDLALARGCRAAAVPYARANRGQPSACLRALARVG